MGEIDSESELSDRHRDLLAWPVAYIDSFGGWDDMKVNDQWAYGKGFGRALDEQSLFVRVDSNYTGAAKRTTRVYESV